MEGVLKSLELECSSQEIQRWSNSIHNQETASSFLHPRNEIEKLSLTSQATRTTRRRFVWKGPEACRKAADTGVRRAPVRSACKPRDLLRYKMWNKTVSFNFVQTFCFSYAMQLIQGFFGIFSCWIPTNADRFLSHCFNYVKLLKKKNYMRPLSDRHKSTSLR